MLPEISVSVKAAVLRGDDILLLSYDDGEFHYNLPGGRARKGEGLRDAVRRKVMQETGLDVVATRLLFVAEYLPARYDGAYGDVQKVQFNFLTERLDGAQPRMSEPPDPIQVGFEWVPLAALPGRPLLPAVGKQLVAAIGNPAPDALVDDW